MVGIGNEGLTIDRRPGEKNSGPANFRRLRKISQPRKFPGIKLFSSPLRHKIKQLNSSDF